MSEIEKLMSEGRYYLAAEQAITTIATLRERVAEAERERAKQDSDMPCGHPHSYRIEVLAVRGDETTGTEDCIACRAARAEERVRELGELRPEVLAFAQAMERKLREHDATRGATGWKADEPLPLFRRLQQEVAELEKEVPVFVFPPRGSTWGKRILSEAADVGNMAMMVADVCGGLALSPPAAVEPTPAREESIYTVMRVPAEILVPAPADELRRRALAADRAYLGLPTPAPAPGALTLTPPAPGLTVDVPPREKTPAPDLLDGTVYGAGAVERRPGHASGMDPARCGDGCSGCATCCGCHECHPTPQREEVDRGD